MATLKDTIINDTGFLQSAVGTTAERPGSSAAGMTRYNSDLGYHEWYTGSQWLQVGVKEEFIAATGGTITTCGDYKIHTFNASGTFTVTCVGNPAGSSTVDVALVAGGGGTDHGSGPQGPSSGGGGGGVAYRTSTPVTATGHPVTVGGGGAAGTPGPSIGRRGNPSSVFSLTTVGGGGASVCSGNQGEMPGGSGAGGGYFPGVAAGTATQPSQNPGVSNLVNYGNPGGAAGSTPAEPQYSVGGGGGAGGAGAAANPTTTTTGAAGGIGVGPPTIPWVPTSIGDSGYFSGGGGGSTQDCTSPVPGGAGGTGGGGNGGLPNAKGQDGTTNTGGGAGGTGARYAGGSDSGPGSVGGSGIVVIRYKFQ